MLNIENLTKSINGKKILDHLTLQVDKGHLAILLGPSGVGKSTLLRILNGLETFDQGTVTLDSKTVDLSAVSKTHTIGMVFQHFNLFEHLTAVENVTLALEHVLKKDPQLALQEAQTLLRDYGLLACADQYPSQLSGGQKQRLALCRTLATHPHVVCLDEPTSALDPILTKHVAETIETLVKNDLMVLIATHDLGLVSQLKGTLYLMAEGRIVEKATTDELHENPEQFPQLNQFVGGIQCITESPKT